ncbi:MAG: PaaI family thioesterase [Actinomycetes bacterium]
MTLHDDRPRGPITPTRLRLADATRNLLHAAVAADADDATLERVAELVEEANEVLADVPWRRRATPDFAAIRAERERGGTESGLHALADRAVAGPANPGSVGYTLRRDGDAVVADVEFGPAFEGAPGRVHGGILAAVFDDVLGAAMAGAGAPGFTGRLTVHFLAPVPVLRPVEIRAWMGGRDGRKLSVHAEAHLGADVVARADALFILVALDHFRTHAHDLPVGEGAG